MGKLFGTDGIRGVANEYPMTPEMALRVGKAVAAHFNGGQKSRRIVIGRDTRISGAMIEAALTAGICSAGADVLLAGVLPTPGVAFLTRATQAAAGIVVSASHNPYFDNGIKLFGPDGYKLSDAVEDEIESAILDDEDKIPGSATRNTGTVSADTHILQQYGEFLKAALPEGIDFNGMKLVLDCANGATFQVAPVLFRELQAEVTALFVQPDGININENCGSQHPETLAETVLKTGSDAGLAFDGDGDRLIAVDEAGSILTGDQILAICARHLKLAGRLRNDSVVSTIMSNMGLKLALQELGIRHVIAGVGDRYVLEEMKAHDAVLGGEDSGHTVFLDHQTTGDGILTALMLLEVMAAAKQPLSDLKKVMKVLPQVLINVDVKEKPELRSIKKLSKIIEKTEKELAGKGRVLVRYSGTQPQCRVMVEGPDEAVTRKHCEKIAEVIRNHIGA